MGWGRECGGATGLEKNASQSASIKVWATLRQQQGLLMVCHCGEPSRLSEVPLHSRRASGFASHGEDPLIRSLPPRASVERFPPEVRSTMVSRSFACPHAVWPPAPLTASWDSRIGSRPPQCCWRRQDFLRWFVERQTPQLAQNACCAWEPQPAIRLSERGCVFRQPVTLEPVTQRDVQDAAEALPNYTNVALGELLHKLGGTTRN